MKKIYALLLLTFIFTGRVVAQDSDDSAPIKKEKDSIDLFFDYLNKIRNAIDTNNGSFFSDNFDPVTVDSILLSAPNNSHKEEYRVGLLKGLQSFVSKLHFAINSGSYYDFINYYRNTTDSSYYALFRLYSEGEGINYHKFKIKPSEDSFLIEDVYIFLTGEFLSTSLSYTFKNTFLNDSEKDADLYQKFLVLRNMGMNKKAFQVADRIKDSAFINKSFLVLKAHSAASMGDEVYTACLKEVLERYPKDPSLLLISLDYFYMVKDFNNLFRALDDLKSYTDDDFLNFFRGNYAFEIGEFEMAKESFEYVVEQYPTFFSADFMLLLTYNKLNENKEAVKLLSSLVESGYDKDELIDMVKTDMNQFYKSSDFKSWKKQR